MNEDNDFANRQLANKLFTAYFQGIFMKVASRYWIERFNNLTGWAIYTLDGELILNAGNFHHSADTVAKLVREHNNAIDGLIKEFSHEH